MGYVVWKFFECENALTDYQTKKRKLFGSEVDDKSCTVKDYPKKSFNKGTICEKICSH